ncbi:MAG: hypothetical protein KGQ36_00950 [Rickettsiales bacterium]|nr:hypothetical protein [Rickettsiales bacterium]
MTALLKGIFQSQIKFEGVDNSEKFLKLFCDLYRIELFKDGLDLILTKVKEKDLNFEVKIIKGWDTNVGCYLTEQSKVFNKVFGNFSNSIKKKIILRRLSHNLMAHEMAHALEFESGVNLGEEFRKCIGLDMKDRDPQSIVLKGEIKRLMVEALRAYPQHQFISELFARYFELLSISRDVRANGDFTTAEVMDFFANTTNFIKQKFNPLIKAKIDSKIANHTIEIVNQVRITENKQQFQEKVESFHKKTTSQGVKSWSSNIKSNASWIKGIELEDKKN